MRIDLHVHSKFSSKPSQWFLQKLGCPESFVEPETLYNLAKGKGMDMVTISDHNTIEGALSIAHLPDTFISEEITTFFPEDNCKVHILAWDIHQSIHDDVQHLRYNIYDLAAYLRENHIRHGVAHPLYACNDKLTLDHLEKLLLMFQVFEINGTRDGMQNNHLRKILALLDQKTISRLANKHNLPPVGRVPWRKSVTGGSDDHSGLNIARIHTEVSEVTTLDAFFQGIAWGESRARGQHASPLTMAHNLYSIGFQFFKEKAGLQSKVNKDHFLKFLDLSLAPESPDPAGFTGLLTKMQAAVHHAGIFKKGSSLPEKPAALFKTLAEQVFQNDPSLLERARQKPEHHHEREERWFEFTNRTAHRVLAHYAERLLDSVTSANLFDIFQTVASSGALYTALSPYFVAYTLFTKDRAFCRQALERLKEVRRGMPRTANHEKAFRLAHFTDTYCDTNGVAITLHEHIRLAEQSGDKDFTVITCHLGEQEQTRHLKTFAPIGKYDLPEYPELKLLYPPVLDMLRYVYETGFTHVHVATPGPVGLTGMLVARLLKLPIAGTYHTALPQYAGKLTGDHAMEDLMWRFMVWFNNELDVVYTPSDVIGAELASKGVQRHKLRTYPRGVDIKHFTPSKRNGFFKRYSLNGGPKMLYVGRISKEKNMQLLEEVIRITTAAIPTLNAILVGDGPYRQEMQANLQGHNCTFTGLLQGEDLAQAYASSDLFVFPSTTDTFGKVVLEAQASGLPVIVTDQGGPQENMVHGETGIVAPGDDPQAFAQAVIELFTNPDLLRRMGKNACEAMTHRSLEQCFEQTWQLYATN